MQSEAPDVSTYLEQVPPERKAALAQLRRHCLNILSGYEEVMAYRMPGYQRNGVLEVAFNCQKNYISLYILKTEVVERFRTQLTTANVGKGCILYSKPEKMDFEVIEKLLMATIESEGRVC